MKFIINMMKWTDIKGLLYIMLHGKWLHVHVSVSFTVVLYITTMLFSILIAGFTLLFLMVAVII